MKNISIDKLNEHLFETIEMLKNNNDPKASKNEKIDIETARAIAELGKVAVDGYKVKAQVLNILSKSENPQTTRLSAESSGIFDKSDTTSKVIENQ